MNILKKIFFAIKSIGIDTTLKTTSYSRYRNQVEDQFGVPSRNPSAEARTPQKLENVKTFHNGAYFSYNQGLKLEVSFLSTNTARITWGPGQLAPNYAVSGNETIALKVDSTQVGDVWELTAGELIVRVSGNAVVEYLSNGKIIRRDIPPIFEDPYWTHSAELDDEAVIHGLGERTRFNLRPGTYRFWNTDPGGSYGRDADPLYLTIPLYYCQQQSGGYLAFYENSHDGEAWFDHQASVRFVSGAIRLYVFSGHLPQTLLEYSRLTGRAPMPPRWALGFHHCRWGYKSSAEVKKVLEGFRVHQLPLDAFHFDIDYMDEYRVFSVDPVNYPDFDIICGEMSEEGIKPVVILDPGVKIDHNFGPYTTGLEKDVFCKLPDGNPVRGLVWPGWVNFPDFSNPVTREWWGEYYQRFLEDGVAGFWHDMNEPAAFSAYGESTLPRVTTHYMEGRNGNHEESHNLYGLLMDMAGYEAIRNHRPDQRPWMLTRSGWSGVQRYAWKWTGDVESTWDALKMTIGMVLGLGVSGIPYSGSDIGGFSGNPSSELYTRWFQMSAMMAFFRNHASITTERREPWVYGEETTQICRKMILLRKRLLPYLYTLAWEAHQEGAPFARPLSWLDPENQILWAVDDEYLLGDKILVAPVVEAGSRKRRVLFPAGGWYHYWDDTYTYYPDAREVYVSAPLERIPFFISEGSVIPIQEEDMLSLHIYFSHQSDTVHSYLYQDAGDGFGDYRLDTFVVRCNEKHLALEWIKEGDYPLPDKIKLVVHGGVPDTTQVDGQGIVWDGQQIEVAPFEKLKSILK